MSLSKHRTQLFFLALFLIIITAIACTSQSEPSSDVTPQSSSGSYVSCKGFLSAQDIEDATGITGLVDRVKIVNTDSIPDFDGSGAIANCLIEVFRTADDAESPIPGDSISLSIVQFDANEPAALLYNSTLAAAILAAEQVGDRAEFQQGVVGKDSYLMDVKAGGIGAIVVYVFDSTFISMISTADDESIALLDAQQLVNAAQSVQSRLP